MISRNKLKKAATSEGLRTLSTKTKIKYVEELKSRDNLSNTHIRAMNVIERDLNIVSNNKFVESLKTEEGAVEAMNENLNVNNLSEDDQIDAFLIIKDTRRKIADIFAGTEF